MSCGRILDNDDDGVQLIPQVKLATQESRCCRCQSPDVDVSIRNTPWCRNCFSSQLMNKFAQGLRPAKEYCRPPRGSDKRKENHGSLVVHFTNTSACLILLDLLKKNIQASASRSTAMWRSPVDFSAIEVVCVSVGSAAEYLASNTKEEVDICGAISFPSGSEEGCIRSLVEGLGFKFVLLNLDDMFSKSDCFTEKSDGLVDLGSTNLSIGTFPGISPANASSTCLCSFLEPLTPTSRVTVLSQLVFSSLLRFCAATVSQSNRRKVLLKSTTATTLAIDTLVSVSSGGGWSIAEQIGQTTFLDDVFICRPLAQMVDAEVRHHVLLCDMASHLSNVTSNLSLSASKKNTIPSLIADFLTKLEEEYPMTSSVINRVASKIGNRASSGTGEADTGASSRVCPTCRLPSDPNANSWKGSITLASHAAQPGDLPSPAIEGPKKLSDHLCYSCLGTFRDRPQSSSRSTGHETWVQFPDHVMESATIRVQT